MTRSIHLVAPLVLAQLLACGTSPSNDEPSCDGQAKCDSSSPRWGVNDVSILYPLPGTPTEADQLLGFAAHSLRA